MNNLYDHIVHNVGSVLKIIFVVYRVKTTTVSNYELNSIAHQLTSKLQSTGVEKYRIQYIYECIVHLLVYFSVANSCSVYSKTLALHTHKSQLLHFNLNAFGSSLSICIRIWIDLDSNRFQANGEKQYHGMAKRLKRVNNVYTREKANGYLCVFGCLFLLICLFSCCCFAWICSVRTRHVSKQHGLFYSWYEPTCKENETEKAFSFEHMKRVEEIKQCILLLYRERRNMPF